MYPDEKCHFDVDFVWDPFLMGNLHIYSLISSCIYYGFVQSDNMVDLLFLLKNLYGKSPDSDQITACRSKTKQLIRYDCDAESAREHNT